MFSRAPTRMEHHRAAPARRHQADGAPTVNELIPLRAAALSEMRLHRLHWGVFVVLLWLWASGVAGLWLLMPVGQRLPEGHYHGLLSDGRTLVIESQRMAPSSMDSFETDQVRLWDVETGRLRTYPIIPAGGRVEGLFVSESQDLLKVYRARTRRLSLHDASTGIEVASFPRVLSELHAKDYQAFLRLWVLSPDGRTTAFVNPDEGLPHVEWYDVATGRLLHRLRDCRGPVLFSPDSRHLVVVAGLSLVILDRLRGREIVRMKPPVSPIRRARTWPLHHPPNGAAWPQEFSPAGALLLDGHGNVWETATGTLRLTLPAIQGPSATFTPDSRELVAWGASGTDCWLGYYDVATGQERLERRVPLSTQVNPMLSQWWHLSPYGQWLVAAGPKVIRQRTAAEQWVAKFTGYESLGQDRTSGASVMVETQTGHEIMRADAGVSTCTPDGRYVVAWTEGGGWRLWSVPPRKPLGWFFLGVGTWSIAVALLAWRRARRTVLYRRTVL